MYSHDGSAETVADLDRRNSVGNEELLDNPIWNALGTEHQALAVIQSEARRYPPAIGPLTGTPDQSLESYDALRSLAGAGGILVLFFPDPPALPAGWTLIRGGLLTQMICRNPKLVETASLQDRVVLRRLGASDITAMIELATLTEPGPFRDRTIELGNFYGILEGERLLAMAGQRMRVTGFVEISAVCTHPDERGRGYAGVLMSTVMRDIIAEGATPFLHAFADNPAVSLYQKLGFTQRRTFELAVIKHEE
ncbi:MAG: GNAT family N-acetyltransferase [Bradyrhizobium sp.]|jgi:ribosomal protein S18 acetylase RimI-like enzyme|nr:GNAT family N-acetyltransferase [Bradyrhizobium sp.]